MLMAGLDVGTTGCKITVYQEDGSFLGRVYQDYPAVNANNVHEVDAADIWTAVQKIICSASEKFPEIGGIGITSFGESFVLVDGNDCPLMPAMLYTDTRGIKECEKLIRLFGANKISSITGLAPAYMYSLPKLMWVKRNKPEIWNRVKYIFLIEDFIVYMLSGKRQIDYSLAARTMAFDIHHLEWSESLFNAAGINQDFFSQPVPIGTPAGEIRPELAEQMGLSKKTLIVSISHDQVAAAIGSGIFEEFLAVDGAGTTECITPMFSNCDILKMAAGSYSVVPYIFPGKFVSYAFNFTGGAAAKWFIDNLAGYAAAEASRNGKSVYEKLEANWNHVPTGLLVLPHFSGAATPYMDPGSRAAIIGLTASSTQQEIYLAVLEGVCYEMRLNVETLRKAGIDVKAMRAAGGGAGSRVWLQMKADILNMPISALKTKEAGAAGSAMLVGVALKIFENVQEAARKMVEIRETFLPQPSIQAQYDEIYERYRKLYDAVRPLMN